jgi:hypothetical protein
LTFCSHSQHPLTRHDIIMHRQSASSDMPCEAKVS